MAKSASVQLRDVVKSINKVIEAPLPRTTLQRIGNSVVSQMKTFISRGISPIRGQRRFPAYKPSYQNAIKKGYLKFDKRVRPVNLRLSGDFLSDLRATVLAKSIEIGYRSQKSVEKEFGHRVGANSQRKRPTIPTGREQFNATITDLILTQYEKAFEKALEKL